MTDRQRRKVSPEKAVRRFVSRHDGTENTVRSYSNRLQDFLLWADEYGIDHMHDLDGWAIDEYREYLEASENAPTTIKGKLTALTQLLKYCESLEVVEDGLHEKVELPTLTKEEETSDEKLEADEASRLLEHFRNSPRQRGTANHVLLELMWHVGGRISCFRALDLGDWYPDERKLEFRHRPPTRLKDGTEHERNVVVSEGVAEAIDFWIERERPEKRDDNGRKPLLTTNHGRASESTIRFWSYLATQPCLYRECPHNRDRPSCPYTDRSKSSKCPSSRAPHAVRTGSITWQLNRGLSYVRVAERVAASPETIRRYYDKPDYDEQLARRRPDTEGMDVLNREVDR
ncbi:site-specific tyrosine recombinase XerD [Halolamina pelagica]|uniref:Site-specific tyrosine recombinase XerD n=1 Tax=Halolamina pelagica TaxID=699431 RepID=A0A0P7GRR2_9EURY|nr:site-specific integrase [Halolamina pelagica]KPN31500.1 site-specific tyrosine recombinase XerD [Halolamina pelagica]